MVVENVLHGIMCKFLRNPQQLFCEIKSLDMMLFLPFLTEMVMKSSNAFVE